MTSFTVFNITPSDSSKILHKLEYDLLGKHTPNEAKKGMKDNFCLKKHKK